MIEIILQQQIHRIRVYLDHRSLSTLVLIIIGSLCHYFENRIIHGPLTDNFREDKEDSFAASAASRSSLLAGCTPS